MASRDAVVPPLGPGIHGCFNADKNAIIDHLRYVGKRPRNGDIPVPVF